MDARDGSAEMIEEIDLEDVGRSDLGQGFGDLVVEEMARHPQVFLDAGALEVAKRLPQAPQRRFDCGALAG